MLFLISIMSLMSSGCVGLLVTVIIIKEKKRKAREANYGFVETKKDDTQEQQPDSSVVGEKKEN